MRPGFDDSQNFAQAFGFASREAIFRPWEFQKIHQVGFCQGNDTGMG